MGIFFTGGNLHWKSSAILAFNSSPFFANSTFYDFHWNEYSWNMVPEIYDYIGMIYYINIDYLFKENGIYFCIVDNKPSWINALYSTEISYAIPDDTSKYQHCNIYSFESEQKENALRTLEGIKKILTPEHYTAFKEMIMGEYRTQAQKEIFLRSQDNGIMDEVKKGAFISSFLTEVFKESAEKVISEKLEELGENSKENLDELVEILTKDNAENFKKYDRVPEEE